MGDTIFPQNVESGVGDAEVDPSSLSGIPFAKIKEDFLVATTHEAQSQKEKYTGSDARCHVQPL